MLRAAITLVASVATAFILFAAEPASACEKHAHAKAAAEKQDADPGKVLQSVDDALSATCNCSGPSDCTCKKGQCKCAKCQKHHHGVQKTERPG